MVEIKREFNRQLGWLTWKFDKCEDDYAGWDLLKFRKKAIKLLSGWM